MKNLARKSSTPGKVVMEFYAATYSTANAFMLLDQHRTFFRADLTFEVLGATEAEILLNFAF